MKKIGEFLRDARMSQGVSLEDLSRETKIKTEFLESLENEKWEKLPELPVVVGFVKNVSHTLSLNKDQCIALLRRDYPPKKITLNPKPEIKSNWQIGPRTVLGIFVGLILLFLSGYLFYQYHNFVSAPVVTIISPSEGEQVFSKTLTVRGNTDASAVVRVNNQPAEVDSDGSFVTEIGVIPDTHVIEIKAISRSGRETVVKRTIYVSEKK